MSGPIGNVLYYVYDQYGKKLTDLLSPFIYEGFATQWTRTKDKYADKWNTNIFEKFQMRVSRIPEWNSTDVKQEGERIRIKLNCTYIDKLLEKVFLLKAQILSTVKDTGDKKIKVIIPPFDHFIHQCYIVTSKEIMLNPQLFEDRDNFINYDDKLNRLKTAFEIIRTSILIAVRDLLPLDQLLTDTSDTDVDVDVNVPETDSRESKTHENIKPTLEASLPVTTPINKHQHQPLDPFEKEMLS
jgi:hypothetical protein